jgi:hypothetical protein
VLNQGTYIYIYICGTVGGIWKILLRLPFSGPGPDFCMEISIGHWVNIHLMWFCITLLSFQEAFCMGNAMKLNFCRIQLNAELDQINILNLFSN